MANDHIGVTGNTMYRGIPAITVAWNNGTARTLTVFNNIDKTPEAEVKDSKDNTGEPIEFNRTNMRVKIKFSCKPVSTTKALALAIAADLPQKMDILTITAASDAQIDSTGNTTLCDSASAKWTPEGELVVDIEATTYTGKTFTAFS
jgi:hypothetical protein